MERIKWSYLPEKFSSECIANILERVIPIIKSGALTLGKPVEDFENVFAAKIGVKHAIAVASGTDAIKLSLKAVGIKHGDEVITAANTFIATAGAICELGAIPVFVDVTDNFCIDATKIEAAITPRTKAIVPVHLTGQMADMIAVLEVAARHGLHVVEDACQAFMAYQIVPSNPISWKYSGTWGALGAFSLHPLKNLSVWGDGGMIVTDNDEYAKWLRLYRNHGLRDRDNVEIMGCNSRLDTIQAVVGSYLLEQIDWIIEQRVKNALLLDTELLQIPQVRLSARPMNRKITFQLYENFFECRDELLKYLHDNGVEAKIHYPVSCYKHAPFAKMICPPREEDYPVTNRHVRDMLSLPMSEHSTQEQLQYIVDCVKGFYAQ